MKTSEFIPPLSARAIIYYDNMSRVSFPLLSSARLKWIIAALVILLLPLSQVSAVEIPVSAGCTLAQAITSANEDAAPSGSSCAAGSGDDIIILRGDITLDAALPAITSTISIRGNAHSISGDETYRIFNVTSGGNLTIDRLTVTKGEVGGNLGGCVRIHGGNGLTIRDSVLRECSSGGNGGALYAGTGVVHISGSRFINNVAGGNGGGIIALTQSTAALDILIEDSVFEDNTAGNDGALTFLGDTNSVNATIRNSVIRNNTARRNSGGIGMSGDITLSLENSAVYNNTANNGGGMYIYNGTVTVENSVFYGNSAPNGGGIRLSTLDSRSTDITLTHVTIVNNKSGGLIDDNSQGATTIKLYNSLLAGNADDCVLQQDATVFTSTGSLIADGSCSPALSGDARVSESGRLLEGSPAIGAGAADHCLATDYRGFARPVEAGCDIGAFNYLSPPRGIITVDAGCTLYQAIRAAADIPSDVRPPPEIGSCEYPDTDNGNSIILPPEGWTTLTAGPLNICQSKIPPITIEGNNHTINGGKQNPIFILCNVNVTIKNLTMINGKAFAADDESTVNGNDNGNGNGFVASSANSESAGNGGAISVSDGSLTLENSPIRNSFATGSGGAIYSKNSEVAINNSAITGNTSSKGGGIYASEGAVTIGKGSVISGNVSDMSGGGIYANGNEIKTIIDNSSITGNSAKGNGGGVYAAGGMVTISNKSVLSDNMADGDGGGVYVNEAIELLLENSVLKNSSAKGNGGGIHAAGSTATINNSAIQTSSAWRNGGGISVVSSTATIENSAVSGNTAALGGGVFVGEESRLNLEDSTITDNSATAPRGVGGGLFGSYFRSISVQRSSIGRNQATLQGGGIMVERGDAMIMANSTIYENKTNAITGEGGGIFVRDGIAGFYHTTLAYNEAGSRRGGGLYMLDAAEVHLRNSIIAGSKGGDCRVHVPQSGQLPGRLDTNEYNIIQDGSCATPEIFTRDPMLGSLMSTSPAYFPLQPGSFAIDIIDTDSTEVTCPETDQLGRERPVGKACDIGAVEFVPPPPRPRPSPAEDDDEEEEEPTPPKPPVNTCLTLPESIRVRPGTGGVQCQRVAEAATVGNQTVIDAGLIDAVDVWGWMGYGVEVCFRNHHKGILLFLDAATAPRSLSALPLHTATDMTCSFIDSPGTIALVHQPSTPSVQAALAAGLQDCKVSTTAIVNFRDGPGGNLIMGFIDPRGDRIDGWLPQGVTLTALARTQKWFKVDYHGNIGWISADYVIPQGSCDEGSGLRAAGA